MKEEYATERPARTSKLPLIVQEKIVAELTELTYALVDRLESVLTPEEELSKPDGAMTTDKPPVQSQLASQLDDNNARIRKANIKLSSILERLEV